MFKLGGYVTIREGILDYSISNLSGVTFKLIAIEHDNDRGIISMCSKTELNREQERALNSRFYYSGYSIGFLNDNFDYLEDEFSEILTYEEWLDDDDEDDYDEDNYNEDYNPETNERTALVNLSHLRVFQGKKGNTSLF